jgi:hypothetical protein
MQKTFAWWLQMECLFIRSDARTLAFFSEGLKFLKQIMKPFFFLDFLTLENGIDILSRKVGTELHSTLRNIPEERRSQAYRILM